MAAPSTRTEFKDYCLRRLGFPVIQINVDDDQVDDRIDDALQFFHDYHFDGVEKIYMKHRITQDDIDRKFIYCPDPVIFVTKIFPFDDSNSSINMFDLRYQLRLHDLYDFTSVSYVSYEITMQHITTLNMLFSGYPQHRGTVTATNTSNVMTGTGTTFDQQILEGDIITVGGQDVQVNRIISPTQAYLTTNLTTSVTDATATKTGVSDVWDDRFLKQYATALIKYQWGTNLSKFAGVQMPGGVTLDGPRIMAEAQVEIDKIETEMQAYNVLPPEILTG